MAQQKTGPLQYILDVVILIFFFFFFLLLSAGVQLLYAVMWINVNQLFRVLMLCNVKRLNDVVSV